MRKKDVYLEMVRGDTLLLTLKIKNLTRNLSSIFFTCKEDLDSNDYKFQKSLGNGIELIDSTDNSRTYKITVSPSDTSGINFNREFIRFKYDIQLGIDDNIFTPYIGDLGMLKDRTRN